MPSSFPLRDLTNQYISRSYQDVVQNYTPGAGDINEYLLDGLGNVVLVVSTASITSPVITSDITSSMSVLSASYSDISAIANVALISDTASIAANADVSISSSWASSSLSASLALASITADFALDSQFSVTASYVSASGIGGVVGTSSIANSLVSLDGSGTSIIPVGDTLEVTVAYAPTFIFGYNATTTNLSQLPLSCSTVTADLFYGTASTSTTSSYLINNQKFVPQSLAIAYAVAL